MGKRLAVIIAVVIVVAAIVFGLTRNKNSNTAQTNNTNSSSQTNNSSQSQTQATATNSVTIQNFAFMPPDITVKKGTTVTWTNQDSTTHTVSEMDGQTGPDSGNLSPGAKYSFTFSQAGTFKYRCTLHPEMLGTVTVTD